MTKNESTLRAEALQAGKKSITAKGTLISILQTSGLPLFVIIVKSFIVTNKVDPTCNNDLASMIDPMHLVVQKQQTVISTTNCIDSFLPINIIHFNYTDSYVSVNIIHLYSLPAIKRLTQMKHEIKLKVNSKLTEDIAVISLVQLCVMIFVNKKAMTKFQHVMSLMPIANARS